MKEGQTMQCQKKDKRTKNDFQNTTQKVKDRATQTLLKTGEESRSTGDTRHVTVERLEHQLTYKQLSIICFLFYIISSIGIVLA